MAGDRPTLAQHGDAIIEVVSDPSHIQDPNIRRFFGLWLDACQGDPKPDKSFIDPFRLRFMIGSIVLLEVHENPLRFRYRLVGTDIVDRVGVELTGKWLEEHPDSERMPLVRQTFTLAVTSRQAVHTRVPLSIDGEPWQYEGVIVPLFGGGERVTHLGGAQTFPPSAPRWRRPPAGS